MNQPTTNQQGGTKMKVISQDGKRTMLYIGCTCLKEGIGDTTYIVFFAKKGMPQVMAVYDNEEKAKNILMEIAHQAESDRDFCHMPE